MKPTLVITGLPVRISHDLQTLLEQAISSALEDFPDEAPCLSPQSQDRSPLPTGRRNLEIRCEYNPRSQSDRLGRAA